MNIRKTERKVNTLNKNNLRKEKEYFKEVENYIKRNEINKRAIVLEENYNTLNNYWNIGRLLVEAQGGKSRAKYGNELIKTWSKDFTERYGKGYNPTNLKNMRSYFLTFPKSRSMSDQLTWTHIRYLLPVKDENKRNYYINLCISKNLSSRELIMEIKNNSYERLIDKPTKIEIISFQEKEHMKSNMMNPIVLSLQKNKTVKDEKDLELIILSQLKSFFNQLGNGFTFVDNQYKIIHNSRFYFIDILLFNIDLNCYIVVELKNRELKREDKSQVEFYMKLIDNTLKKAHHNKTTGIIISKKQEKFIAEFVENDSLITLTYETVHH